MKFITENQFNGLKCELGAYICFVIFIIQVKHENNWTWWMIIFLCFGLLNALLVLYYNFKKD